MKSFVDHPDDKGARDSHNVVVVRVIGGCLLYWALADDDGSVGQQRVRSLEAIHDFAHLVGNDERESFNVFFGDLANVSHGVEDGVVQEIGFDADTHHDWIFIVRALECRGVVWHETKIPFQGFPVRFVVGFQQQGIDALSVDG